MHTHMYSALLVWFVAAKLFLTKFGAPIYLATVSSLFIDGAMMPWVLGQKRASEYIAFYHSIWRLVFGGADFLILTFIFCKVEVLMF